MRIRLYHTPFNLILTVIFILIATGNIFGQQRFLSNDNKNSRLYHKDWIDFNKNGKKDVFEDKSADLDKRIDDLISQMTLDEKTCQMVTLYGFGRVLTDELPNETWKQKLWKDGIGNIDEQLNGVARHKKAESDYTWPPSKHAKAINEIQRFFVEETRLGIPVDFTNEGIRGLCQEKATGFPAEIGMGSTWNRDLVHQVGIITGKEAKATGFTNVYSPVLDVARDPRWGRIVECYGEDPYLVSEYGKQMVTGIQSQGVASTAKHFAVYSAPKGGRDGEARNDPKVTLRELHEIYLMPFKEIVTQSKVLGLMSSYNDYDGIPITASNYFLTEILRENWGFNGYIVSDSWAVGGLQGRHHVAENFKESVFLSVMAGLNVHTDFLLPDTFVIPLRELVNEGRIPDSVIDERVKDILRVKFINGLFDNPYVENPAKADEIFTDKGHKAISLEASRESMVLLKNDGLLPLDPEKYASILITGPNAKDINHSISRYGPSNIDVVSALDGIKNLVGNAAKIEYAKGCDFYDENWPENEIIDMPISEKQQLMIDEAVEKAKNVDVIIALVGDHEATVGESRSRTALGLPGNQEDLIKALYATGKPVVVVLINGRPLTINWINKYIPAILEAWFPGPYGGQAIADVLFGNYNPGGKLSVTFPKTVGQIPWNFPFKHRSQAAQHAWGSENGSGYTRIDGALYPFGYGLSYTKFEYSELHVMMGDEFNQNSPIKVTFNVKNTGKIKGDEVPQFYIKDLVCSVSYYESVLRGFERITLEPEETKQVEFFLYPKDLALLDANMEFTVEPGDFNILVGSSCEDIKLKETITIR